MLDRYIEVPLVSVNTRKPLNHFGTLAVQTAFLAMPTLTQTMSFPNLLRYRSARESSSVRRLRGASTRLLSVQWSSYAIA